MASIDWLKIKNEYISGGVSYRKLSEKHGVSFNTLKSRATKEQWHNCRKELHNKITTKSQQKTQEKIVESEARIIDRKYELSEKLLDKLERAIDELDISLVTNKRKTRVIEYKDDKAIGKPTKEVIDETEEILQIASIVDRAGIKQLASALKDIKDIQAAIDERTRKADQREDDNLWNAVAEAVDNNDV